MSNRASANILFVFALGISVCLLYSAEFISFRKDETLGGLTCPRADTVFSALSVLSNIQCALQCSRYGTCVVAFYKPSEMKCVGCNTTSKENMVTEDEYIGYVLDCGNPPDVPNAMLLGSTNTLTYECAPDYFPTASSNATRTCTKSGWEPANNFSCFTCGEPNEVFGASLNGSGQVRQYVCNTDDPEHLYPVSGTGNGTITCDENTQTWSPEGFRCGGLRLKANHPQMQAIPNCGYLEFFHNNEWRAVTYAGWDWRATKVACNTLGFKFGGTFHRDWFDVENPQRLAAAYKLDNIACFGNETSLELCSDIDPKDGNIDKEIALTCFDYDITAPGNVELDPGPFRGDIRVKIAATYGNLCGEDWSDEETGVVCRTMNPNWRRYDECKDNCNVIPKQPYKTNYIDCEGDEPHLFYCENRGWGYTTDCDASKLVKVECGP